MKLCTVFVVTLALLPPTFAGDKVKDKKTKDAKEKDKKLKETIFGTWSVTALSVDGAKPSTKGAAGSTVTITMDSFTVRGADGKAEPASLKHDEEKKPGTIDITHNREGKSETMHGIFELAGDNLKVCFGLPSLDKGGARVSVRPTSLEPGEDRFLLILKRNK